MKNLNLIIFFTFILFLKSTINQEIKNKNKITNIHKNIPKTEINDDSNNIDSQEINFKENYKIGLY